MTLRPKLFLIVFLWSALGITIIITAIVFLTPNPPTPTAGNNEITHQVANTISSSTPAEELAAGQRVCESVNKLLIGAIGPPLTVDVCIAANKDCENLWGPHAIWAGRSDSDNVPVCFCDVDYKWASDDSGKCIARQ